MAEQNVDWKTCLQHAAITDIGMRRSNNQDSHKVALASDVETWHQRGHVFMVADGMGAHAAGELASKLAVDGIPHLYLKYRDFSPPEALQKAVLETNAEVNRRGEANADFHNMGTTCSVLVLLPQGALVAHIGDSRVYRLRGTQLEQLTFDHSLVWEMRAAGQLPADSAIAHMVPKNVITRSLGPSPSVQVDIEGPFPIEVGDTFLLCSDGLTGKVEDDELGRILASLPPDEAARVLVDLANLRGGPDNITIIIVRVTGQKITTRVAASEPLMIGGTKTTNKAHPALWAASGACLLAALGMSAVQSWIPAVLAAGGGMATLCIALFQMFRGPLPGVSLSDGRRLGRGPYTKSECSEGPQFVNKLASIVQQLRNAGVAEQWNVDWEPFEAHCASAAGALRDGQFAQAVREYARSISFIMRQLRTKGRPKKASDSSIDLM